MKVEASDIHHPEVDLREHAWAELTQSLSIHHAQIEASVQKIQAVLRRVLG